MGAAPSVWILEALAFPQTKRNVSGKGTSAVEDTEALRFLPIITQSELTAASISCDGCTNRSCESVPKLLPRELHSASQRQAFTASSLSITAPGREPRSATPVRLWWFPSTDYREPAHDLRMYEKIVIILLLSGYISTQNVSETTAHELPSLVSTEKPSLTTSGAGQEPLVTRHQQFPGARQQINHNFSEPAIIGIIYAVMLGIIITILSFAFCIGQLTKKSSLPVQSSSPEDADSEVL
ncbi:uncharacterized protein LOC114208170 [Eumetopias jubatus]|uniref:uncharacterized protein LOC114208170 n=1 Tax=Eumetopias jubatus TaxID=34886 RepID=UPI001016225A|nr:uncharacterized protein LOC114208170 [Eumetopias jubatus]